MEGGYDSIPELSLCGTTIPLRKKYVIITSTSFFYFVLTFCCHHFLNVSFITRKPQDIKAICGFYHIEFFKILYRISYIGDEPFTVQSNPEKAT